MAKKENDTFEEQLNPPEHFKIKKKVKVQYDNRQYSIRLPIKIVRTLGIKKGTPVTFEVDPTQKKPTYTIKIGE